MADRNRISVTMLRCYLNNGRAGDYRARCLQATTGIHYDVWLYGRRKMERAGCELELPDGANHRSKRNARGGCVTAALNTVRK